MLYANLRLACRLQIDINDISDKTLSIKTNLRVVWFVLYNKVWIPSPTHSDPSNGPSSGGVKPKLHLHEKLPYVFVQVAFSWQTSIKHSSKSIYKIISMCTLNCNLSCAAGLTNEPVYQTAVMGHMHYLIRRAGSGRDEAVLSGFPTMG